MKSKVSMPGFCNEGDTINLVDPSTVSFTKGNLTDVIISNGNTLRIVSKQFAENNFYEDREEEPQDVVGASETL